MKTKLWLVIIAVVALACAAVAQSPYVTITGQFIGPNGLPLSNATVGFTPNQSFFVANSGGTVCSSYLVEINGTLLTCGDTINFNNTTPAAPTNGLNVQWSTSKASGTDSVSAAIVGDGNAGHCLIGTGVFATCPIGSSVTGTGALPFFPVFTNASGAATVGDSFLQYVTSPNGLKYTTTSGQYWQLDSSGLNFNTGVTGNVLIQNGYNPGSNNNSGGIVLQGAPAAGSACSGAAILQGGQADSSSNGASVTANGGCWNSQATSADVDITASSTGNANNGGNVVIKPGTSSGGSNGVVEVLGASNTNVAQIDVNGHYKQAGCASGTFEAADGSGCAVPGTGTPTVYTYNATAHVGNITATVATPSAAQSYLVTCYVVMDYVGLTSAATAPACNVVFTDGDTSQSETVTVSPSVSSPIAVGTNSQGTATISVAASTAIQITTTGYVSVPSVTMQYAVHMRLVPLG